MYTGPGSGPGPVPVLGPDSLKILVILCSNKLILGYVHFHISTVTSEVYHVLLAEIKEYFGHSVYPPTRTLDLTLANTHLALTELLVISCIDLV